MKIVDMKKNPANDEFVYQYVSKMRTTDVSNYIPKDNDDNSLANLIKKG